MNRNLASFPFSSSDFKKVRHAAFWLLGLALLTAPLLWVQIQFDDVRHEYVARFHWDRLAWWTQQLPRDIAAHGLLWLELGAVAVGAWVIRRFFQSAAWLQVTKVGAQKYSSIPAELRMLGWLLILPVLTVFLCAHLDDQQRGWGIFVGIYIVLAMGLNFTVGMTGLLVLGYAAFYAIGAYTFGLLHQQFGIPFWVAFAPAAVVGGLVGLLLGLPSSRLRGDYLAIVTLGFGEVLRILLKNFKGLTGGDEGLLISGAGKFPKFGPVPFFAEGVSREASGFCVIVVLVIASIWLVRNLVHSRIGRAWIAIREDETAAAAMGIPVFRLKLLAFALSAAWAGVAGVCYAAYQGHIVPDSFGFIESVLILSMVVLGGMGTVAGPVFGAAGFYLTYELLRNQLPALTDYRLMIFGALMVVMMVFRPQGLLGSRRRKIELGMET